MEAFILEILLSRGWRRGGEIFWTQADAKRAGAAMLKHKVARQVRVLPVQVNLEAVAELGRVTETAAPASAERG